MRSFSAARLAVLALSGAFTMLACQPVTVGISCKTRSDCAPAQECATEPLPDGGNAIPDGFCTKGCVEPGSTRECPGGSTCIAFSGVTQSCSPICTTDADCRTGYTCLPAKIGSTVSACHPAN